MHLPIRQQCLSGLSQLGLHNVHLTQLRGPLPTSNTITIKAHHLAIFLLRSNPPMPHSKKKDSSPFPPSSPAARLDGETPTICHGRRVHTPATDTDTVRHNTTKKILTIPKHPPKIRTPGGQFRASLPCQREPRPKPQGILPPHPRAAPTHKGTWIESHGIWLLGWPKCDGHNCGNLARRA